MRRSTVIALFAISFLVGGLARASAATGDVTLPLCSAAVHDSYKTTGPDGQQYATWHPQIDHQNICHFDHEHGSNPALLKVVAHDYAGSSVPLYGYTVAKHGTTEGHAGFKTYTFRLSGHTWMVTNHFGTGSPQVAACQRFHTVDIVIVDGSGTVEADLHIMADFGKATTNEASAANLMPPSCPTQANVGASTGQRQFPIANSQNVAYEPWRIDAHELPAIGFRSGGLSFNTNDPQKACADVECASGVQMLIIGSEPSRGVSRFLTFGDGYPYGPLRISGAVTGTFYTDPMGETSLPQADPHAVKQFVAPGFSIDVPVPLAECRIGQSGGNETMYWCSDTVASQVQIKLNRLVTGPN